MDAEYKANNEIREYLEKTYELIYAQMGNEWEYYQGKDITDEKEKRRIMKQGVQNEEDEKKVAEVEKKSPGMFQAKNSSVDPKQFAEMLGMPFSSLLMLMKEHHERDPVVKNTIHENVSFIKV